MMKLATIFKSRGNVSGQVFNKCNYTQDVVGLHGLMKCAGISTVGQKGSNTNTNGRIFAPYHVYKGKAALRAEPIPPQFTKLDSGGMRIKRQGFILLTFSPAAGERKYNWDKKQIFALSATEIGSMIALGPNGSCEFFHDPAMKTSNAGQVRKSLSIKANSDGTGYFMSLTVANNVEKTNERFTLPVTSAEFAVMRTSFSFALPHIMGWDRYSSQLPNFEGSSTKFAPRSLGSEWDR